ncbi:MAG: carbohydrate binding domain-containing protein [Armatimonadota bacterium]
MSRTLTFSLICFALLVSAVQAQPAAPAAALDLRNLTARSIWQESGDKFDLQLRFISSLPATASATVAGVLTGPEQYPSNNHRLDVIGLSGRQPVQVKLAVTTPSGAAVERTLNVAPPTAYPAAKAGKVELKVIEPSGKDRTRLPVTSGLPLPKGALYRADNTRLLAAGTPLPLQARAQARWEDGSIKWLLLDTQVDLKAGETRKLVLEYGGAAATKATTGLKVTELSGRGGVVVDTGALRAILPLTGKAEFRSVAGDKLLSTLDGSLTDAEGVVWGFVPEDVRVLEASPLRATVRMDGHYRAGDKRHFLGSTLVTLYAGKPYARTDVLFGNDLVDVVMTPIKSLYLDLEGSAAGNAAIGVVDGEALAGTTGMQANQQFDDGFIAQQASQAKGKRLAGWVKTDNMILAMKDLWQQYPKSLGVTPQGVRIGICPNIAPADLYANKPDEEKLYYYLRDGNYTFRRGMMKRHEMWLGPAGEAEEVVALAARHATLTAAPEYYQQSKAAGDILPAKPQHFAMYDEILGTGVDAYLAERERNHEYGLMNYGDWWGERGLNWGNEEYDLQVGMLQQYLRTGDPRFFYVGEAAARHNTEIDTIHWAATPTRVPNQSYEPMPGQVWVHSMGHTGGYYPRDYKNMEVYGPGYATNRGHMWVGGNFLYGMLSGDPRVLDSARLTADWMSGADCNNFEFGNAREPGWMGMAVMSAFRATRDPYYLNAADIMFTKVHEKAQETKPEYGLYFHILPNGHCNCPPPKHHGEAGFMAGVLMTSMKRFYEETGREQVADDIVGIAHYVRDTLWEPTERNFRYTSCPKSTISSTSGGIINEGLAFAANRTNDEELREIVRATFAASMLGLKSSGGGGKSAGYLIHSMPAAMVEIDKFPGPSFDVAYDAMLKESRSPALATLPTIMPNPDFEEGVSGWNCRTGFTVEPTTEVVHGGRMAARVSGTGKAQNEYLVTRYECGPPWEIMSLQPGKKYRLSAWLRVDEITPGTPAPNLRCALRAKGRTRDAFQTTAYDLSKLGTWQCLKGEFTAADYTDAAYVAVNMNTKEQVAIVMYVDGINLTSADAAEVTQYSYPSLVADKAEVGTGLSLTKHKLSPQWQMLTRSGDQAGQAVFPITVDVAGDYAIFARGRGKGSAQLTCDGKPAGALVATADNWQWLRAQKADGQPVVLRLEPGNHKIGLRLPEGDGKLGVQKIVLSNDLSPR